MLQAASEFGLTPSSRSRIVAVDIKNRDIKTQDYIELLLKKEIIFDRLAITDFEFEEQQDGRIRYILVCPKCGKRAYSKK